MVGRKGDRDICSKRNMIQILSHLYCDGINLRHEIRDCYKASVLDSKGGGGILHTGKADDQHLKC